VLGLDIWKLFGVVFTKFMVYFGEEFFISFDQQSECNVFHKLMSWEESSLWTN